MSRPRGDLCVDWKLRLSLPVAAALEQITMDPTTGKPRYGARRRLLESLINRYLKEIGWHDAAAAIAARRPLSDADLSAVEANIVERIYD